MSAPVRNLDDIRILDLNSLASADGEARRAIGRQFVQLLGEDQLIGIEGHPVCTPPVDVGAQVRELFAQPLQRYAGHGMAAMRGYSEGYRDQMMWHTGPELTPDSPLHGRLPPNIWVDALPQFRPAVLHMYALLEDLARELMSLLAFGLDADEPAWRGAMQHHSSVWRFIYFPAHGDFAPGDIRLDEHVDGGMFAILPPADGGGLEALRDGAWRRVPSRPGVVYTYAGSMLEQLSNGRIPAVQHRVVSRGFDDITRLSFPFFMVPHPDFVLAPPAAVLAPGEQPRWPSRTVEQSLLDYMGRYLAHDHDSGWARKVLQDDPA